MKEKRHIWEAELQEIGATHLLDWQQQEPFTPPSAYFQQFSAQFKEKLEDEVMIGRDSLLSQVDRAEPFEAPQGYFDSFEARLEQKLQTQPQEAVVRKLQPRWRVASIAAAILILIVGTWITFTPQLMPNSGVYDTQDELIAFIETEGIDAYTIAEAFEGTDEELHAEFELSSDDWDQLIDEQGIDQWDLEGLIEEEI